MSCVLLTLLFCTEKNQSATMNDLGVKTPVFQIMLHLLCMNGDIDPLARAPRREKASAPL